MLKWKNLKVFVFFYSPSSPPLFSLVMQMKQKKEDSQQLHNLKR